MFLFNLSSYEQLWISQKLPARKTFDVKNPTKTLHEVYIFSNTIFTNITNMKVVLSVSI